MFESINGVYMNIANLLGLGSKGFALFALVLVLVFGSHVGLDYLVSWMGDGCVNLDSATKLCLEPRE